MWGHSTFSFRQLGVLKLLGKVCYLKIVYRLDWSWGGRGRKTWGNFGIICIWEDDEHYKVKVWWLFEELLLGGNGDDWIGTQKPHFHIWVKRANGNINDGTRKPLTFTKIISCHFSLIICAFLDPFFVFDDFLYLGRNVKLRYQFNEYEFSQFFSFFFFFLVS